VAFDDRSEFRIAGGLRETIQIEDLGGTKPQAGFLDIDEQCLDHVGGRENLFKPLGRPRETEVDHRLDDRLLAREVVIEVARTDAGFGTDICRAGAAEAVPDEAADRRAEDFPALLLMLNGVDFPQTGHLHSHSPRLARRFATRKSKLESSIYLC